MVYSSCQLKLGQALWDPKLKNLYLTHITFIGGGTMACAILDGLAESMSTTLKPGQAPEHTFSITTRRQERTMQLSERYPRAYVTDSNDDGRLWELARNDESTAHIVLICTKPQSTLEVCQSIRLAHKSIPAAYNLPIVVTMCPGITIAQLESWLNPHSHSNRFPVVRTMPNTPVSIRQGATALVPSRWASASEVDCVVTFFRVFSPCVEVLPKETLLDVAAAVSGSGPAWIFQYYKSLIEAAVQWGLPEDLARSLIMQTGIGASMLANEQPEISLSSMISDVCVPGGSTEKGIKRLVDLGLQEAVADAVGTSLGANHRMGGHPSL
ncbi:hypothetical protein EJ08DRAFT_670300 [Tothia fuscella]|uniref:Pyrroline-5-carboxylate reductase n=1 Tax=Tothia fuscella TaxID=1048955 RepID=A0A9P4TYL4_9PEZI|nr:hypothetical protein EJ08DRAFT_670300 [Tothia fuscella]